MGIVLPGASSEQCEKFDHYLSLLLKWNRVHNLTAIRDANEVVNRHFLESIQLLPHLGDPSSLLDLGTGAGFPGLPLAIMRPDWVVTVVDASHKKISFCQEIIRACSLPRARAICSRVERPSLLSEIDVFDCVVSRATWSLADYIQMAARFVRCPGGLLVAMKGPRYRDEMQEVVSVPAIFQEPLVEPLVVGSVGPEFVVIKYYTRQCFT